MRLSRFFNAFLIECLALLDTHAHFVRLANEINSTTKEEDAALVVTWELLQ